MNMWIQIPLELQQYAYQAPVLYTMSKKQIYLYVTTNTEIY